MLARLPRAFACNGALVKARVPSIQRCAFSCSSATQLNPVEKYDADVKAGKIRSDDHQRAILGNLMSVYNELVTYERPKPQKKSWWQSLVSTHSHTMENTPKGIYLYGDVGSGKTMLMDMFYATVPEHLKKRRIHFHGFMQDIHKRLHELKVHHAKNQIDSDPILTVTHEISSSCDVLCLDEMQVTDIADAMILRHLFEGLYNDGVVTFFTSNREPNELYKHGVQRESFVPSIRMIEAMNHVVYLDSPTDYRKLPRPSSGSYFFGDTHSPEAREHAEKWFTYFADGCAVQTDRSLHIWGRPVPIPRSAGDRVMEFTFMQLCGTARSAADYLELCRAFPCAVITEIPELSLEQRDLVRRFITFLDAAYDNHLKLAATAEKPFDKLFTTKALRIDSKTNQVVLQGSDSTANTVMDVANFPGHEEMFAFARALSRLKQMSSAEWLDFDRNA